MAEKKAVSDIVAIKWYLEMEGTPGCQGSTTPLKEFRTEVLKLSGVSRKELGDLAKVELREAGVLDVDNIKIS